MKIVAAILILLLASLGLAQHPATTPKGPRAVTNAGELDRRSSTPALAQAVILAKALMAQSSAPVVATQAPQATLVSDLFAAPVGTLLEAHAGSYAWSHAGGDASRVLSSNGDGSLSATGPGTGLFYLYGAPLPPLPTVSLTVDPEANTDEGGPDFVAAGGASYAFARCSDGYTSELVVIKDGRVVDDVKGTVYLGLAKDLTFRLSSLADGTLTLRVGDGGQVPDLTSGAAKGLVWFGAGIHADRLRSGTPTRFSSFSISGGPSGTPGILHSRVYRVDVWAASDAAAIATARSSTTGGLPWPLAQYPLMRFVSEAYEATAALPSEGAYPSPAAIATSWAANLALTVDLGPGAQWGYAPDDLPVAEIGPRSSAAATSPALSLFHVYRSVREAFPTPDLPTAQAAQASYYAAWVAFGGPLPGADYLAALPFSAPAAADGSVSFASTAGKTIKVMPLPWAAMRANAVPLSDAWSVMASGAPTFAIPIDPAMVLPVNLQLPNP